MAKLIQLIGTSGTGKSTILPLLAELLRKDGFLVVTYIEPGPFHDVIKKYRLRTDKNPWVESALFAADRTVSFLTDRAPRQEEPNLIFLSDRGFLDSFIYQGILGGVDINSLKEMNSAVPLPDLVILLTVDGQVGYERNLGRQRRTGEPLSANESPERITLLTAHYRQLLSHYPNLNLKEIDTTDMEIEQTARKAYEVIRKHLLEMRIKAVGFDLDGTLYARNPEIDERIRTYTCEEAARTLRLPYEQVRKEFDLHFAELQSGSSALKRLGIENGKEIVQGALEKADISSALKEDVRLRDMLEKFSQKYRLFLVTSSPEGNALRKFKALGIDSKIFDPAFYANLKLIREDGSVFRYISDTFNIPLNGMMFVGDREQTDILPAKSLGIKTAIVNSKSALADYQLTDIYELEEILKKIG